MRFKVEAGRPYPLGVSYDKNGLNISFPCMEEDCGIILYDNKDMSVIEKIPFSKDACIGKIHTMFISGIDCKKTAYRFYVKEEEIIDERAHKFFENRDFGVPSTKPVFCGFLNQKYHWEDDKNPCLSYEDSVVYCMHVRGFTKHSSSKLSPKVRGTFKGIIKKISYLKDLGVTTLELQPAYEFDELEEKKFLISSYSKIAMQNQDVAVNPEYQLNYWGYTTGKYYSPKNNYASSSDPSDEFKDLVKELHKNNMELIMQFYFPESVSMQSIHEILHFWVKEYHIDGFHLKGFHIQIEQILQDPALNAVKIWFFKDNYETKNVVSFWNEWIAQYDDSYRNDLRRFLKGDEGSISGALHQMREKQNAISKINYFSNYDGFTLMDMVSYDRKHNELNEEFNRDGTDFNFSWNCGEEGNTRKKSVKELRVKQLKNALSMLFLSQGTPLVFMGDEFGNTQLGNNNPYCQDNEITWLHWNLQKKNEEIYSFVKQMITFRKAYPVLHMKNGLKLMDYKALGYPDLSYHSEEAWNPQLEYYNRHVGLMYCCQYADDHCDEPFLYIAINMHWEEHEFGLPQISPNTKWCFKFSTEKSKNQLEQIDKKILVPGRSIVVLAGKKIK